MKATHRIESFGAPDKFRGSPCEVVSMPKREKGVIGYFRHRSALAEVIAVDSESGLEVKTYCAVGDLVKL